MLSPTPNLVVPLSGSGASVGVTKIPSAALFYVTDRARNSGPVTAYGSDRSASVGIGTVTVSIGSHSASVDASPRSAASTRRLKLTVTEISESIRLPETPIPFALVEGKVIDEPEARAADDAAEQEFMTTIEAELSATNKSELFLFVHGFNTSFEEAAFSLTDIWHYSGRRTVPILFSWPSSDGGLLGYLAIRILVSFQFST